MARTDFDSSRFASAIADLLNDHFKRAKVVNVKVGQDLDHDGDPVLRVLVV